MRPMLFKKSWNLSGGKVWGHPTLLILWFNDFNYLQNWILKMQRKKLLPFKNLKTEIHGHFNMIILKCTLKFADVFEIHVHFKMIILKREQMFLNLKGWNYNWVFKENTKSFAFKYFQKTEVYLVPIQISKMELFVKIVNSLMPLTILTKSSILDVWLASKIVTNSFNKSFCKFNIFGFGSDLVKY